MKTLSVERERERDRERERERERETHRQTEKRLTFVKRNKEVIFISYLESVSQTPKAVRADSSKSCLHVGGIVPKNHENQIRIKTPDLLEFFKLRGDIFSCVGNIKGGHTEHHILPLKTFQEMSGNADV